MGKIADRLWAKAGLERIPLIGAFELLPVCNLGCKMCYVRKSMGQVQAAGGLLPKEFWLDYARQARDEGLLYPLLTGGEPFLHPDFQEILENMQEMGLQVSVNSNGTLIDEATAQWLSRHRPTRINLTLYGASPETYEALCGDGGAYGRVRRAVELLKRYDIPVKFNASITPENFADLEGIMAYAKSVDSPVQVATYMFPPVRRDSNMVGKNHRLSPEEAGLARVKADFLQNEPAWFLGQAERFRHFVPVSEADLAAQAGSSPREMNCRAGRCSFWLDWQGNMANCGMYASAKFPVRGLSFRDAWQRLTKETARVRYCPVCANCPNYALCHPCIAMVSNETGRTDGWPEYLCRMNAAAARYYREYAEQLRGSLGENAPVPDPGLPGCVLDD